MYSNSKQTTSTLKDLVVRKLDLDLSHLLEIKQSGELSLCLCEDKVNMWSGKALDSPQVESRHCAGRGMQWVRSQSVLSLSTLIQCNDVATRL